MAQSILVFDFGANEEAAQQAKHKVEAWKQGFRLGNKMLLKFEREENADHKSAAGESESTESTKAASDTAKSGKKKTGAQSGAESGAKRGAKSKASAKSTVEPTEQSAPASNGKVRLLLRLDFSDHERLSHQRWLDRIPSEEPFKSASGQTIRIGDPEFTKTAELFESLV